VLVVATPLADVFRERDETIEALEVGIPIAALLAMAGGWWLASVGLHPITAMARRAADLPVAGTGDLGESNRQDELGQLARAFNGLLARLRQALQTERQFIADASHEFRTPVSVIRSAADVALARDHRDEPDYREALAITREQARRLTRLVDDMLVLARADAGGYPFRPVALYLDELVSDCRKTLDVLANERHVRIETGASRDLPFTGDEDLLRRMLLNLVQNAVQHTRAGGAVRVTLSADAAAATIRVADEGEGIPRPQQTRIFERFVQLDAARRHAGAGLGLPIARWIAEAHGGRLDLESSDSHGSTFCVHLPLKGEHAP
jgi:signal transduction histidine kinase